MREALCYGQNTYTILRDKFQYQCAQVWAITLVRQSPHRTVTIREKKSALALRLGKSPGPLMAPSPHQRGRRYGRRSRWGEWYLSKVGEAPFPKQSLQVDLCPVFGGVVITGSGIYRGVTRPKPTYNIA